MSHLVKFGSLAGVSFDHYDDLEFMESMKTQKLFDSKRLPSPIDIENLPDEAFAAKIAGSTRVKKAFPILDAVSTQLSMLYFSKVAHQFDEEDSEAIKQNILDAANKFKINTSAQFFSEEKEEMTPQKDKLVLASLCDSFHKNASILTYGQKITAAKKIKEWADASQLKIADAGVKNYIPKEKFGSNVIEGIDQRDQFLQKQGDYKLTSTWDYIKKIAKAGDVDLFYRTLELFDEHAGMDKIYGEGIYDPALTVYGNMKMASDEGPTASPLAPSTKYTEHSAKDYKPGKTGYKAKAPFQSVKELSTPTMADAVKRRKIYELTRVVSPGMFGSEQEYQLFIYDPVGFYRTCSKSLKTCLDETMKTKIDRYIVKNDFSTK